MEGVYKMLDSRLKIPPDVLKQFCRKHHIQRFAVFGSILDDSFTDKSDIDVLITFEKDCEPGFFRLAQIEQELSDILGRKADIRTSEDLSIYFREDIESRAVVQYAA
jgi:uncharacterized protein